METRFTAPDGWRTGEFIHLATRHKIHYGTASQPDAKGIVVILPGLSEFSEKYYETARDIISRGLDVWVIDWAYQGRSARWEKYPQRRYSDGFDADLQDLHKLISDHIIPAAQGKPLIMLGHSMGGHLGLRYLAEHKGLFKAAIFSAPMIGIREVNQIPAPLREILLFFLRPFSQWYVPRGRDWHETMRKSDGSDIFSSDPVRDALHNEWCRAYPELQIGSPTYRWLFEAVKSCRTLKNQLADIDVPVMLACAEKDAVVDNQAIMHAAAVLPKSTLLTLSDAHHELLMERDAIRDRFLEGFDKMLASIDIQ